MKGNNVIMYDALYPPPVLGGKEKQAHLLASCLVKRHGVQVNAFTRLHDFHHQEDLVEDGVEITRVDGGNYLSEIIGYWRYLLTHKDNFDVVHIHTPSRIGCIVAILAKLIGFVVVFKFPNEHLTTKGRSFINNGLFNTALKSADAFVILENSTKESLLKLGYEREKIFHFPNGIEISNQKDADKSIPQSKGFRFIHVARLCEQKRTGDIIEAFGMIHGNIDIEWELIIAGDGPLKSELENKAEYYGLDEQIRFIGHTDKVEEWLQSSNCFLLASDREGMPNVILEAMKYSLPVIATPVGEVSDMLGEMGQQWQFTPGDTKKLSELIKGILAEDFSISDYGEYLNRRLQQKYSIETVSDMYSTLYSEIISRKKRHRSVRNDKT